MQRVGVFHAEVSREHAAVTLAGLPVARSGVWAVGLAARLYFAWLAAPPLLLMLTRITP